MGWPEQTGFVPGRLASDNAKVFSNILQLTKDLPSPVAAVSIDAEKAFDQVEWRFLAYALKIYGFGEEFRCMIAVLYLYPRARILANGVTSNEYTLGRGTRQGCPLSPLLFILVLEPLLEKILWDPQIKGIHCGTSQVKLSAYADDVLLYLVDPSVSFPVVLDVMEAYSKLSGYKVNWPKTEIMPLNVLCNHSMFIGPPTVWVHSRLKYLGVKIGNTLTDTVDLASTAIREIVKEANTRWSPLNLS